MQTTQREHRANGENGTRRGKTGGQGCCCSYLYRTNLALALFAHRAHTEQTFCQCSFLPILILIPSLQVGCAQFASHCNSAGLVANDEQKTAVAVCFTFQLSLSQPSVSQTDGAFHQALKKLKNCCTLTDLQFHRLPPLHLFTFFSPLSGLLPTEGEITPTECVQQQQQQHNGPSLLVALNSPSIIITASAAAAAAFQSPPLSCSQSSQCVEVAEA